MGTKDPAFLFSALTASSSVQKKCMSVLATDLNPWTDGKNLNSSAVLSGDCLQIN